jgi:hypothetical protein
MLQKRVSLDLRTGANGLRITRLTVRSGSAGAAKGSAAHSARSLSRTSPALTPSAPANAARASAAGIVERHCRGSGPHLCGSIPKTSPRHAALSLQGGFGFGLHRRHYALKTHQAAMIYGFAARRRNSRSIALTRTRYVSISCSPQRSPGIRRNPRRAKAFAAPAPQR